MRLLILILCASLASTLGAQNDFTNCTAILLNNKMVVDQYTPEGKCELILSAEGNFTVQPVSLQENGMAVPQGKRRFKVAIRDGNTKTLLLFSDKTYEVLDAQTVLSQCKKGDSLVFLTLDRDLALPHPEVLLK